MSADTREQMEQADSTCRVCFGSGKMTPGRNWLIPNVWLREADKESACPICGGSGEKSEAESATIGEYVIENYRLYHESLNPDNAEVYGPSGESQFLLSEVGLKVLLADRDRMTYLQNKSEYMGEIWAQAFLHVDVRKYIDDLIDIAPNRLRKDVLRVRPKEIVE